MKKLQRKTLQDFLKEFDDLKFSEVESFLHNLKEIGRFFRNYGINLSELIKAKTDDTLGIQSFLTLAKKSQNPLEVPFLSNAQGVDKLVKKLIPYDLDKPDLLKRLFEEIYLGKSLFTRFYGMPSIFNLKESYIEKEDLIPSKETIDWLHLKFGKMSIYSERVKAQGIYLLQKNNIVDYFDIDNSFFIEEINNPSNDNREVGSFGKPNPTRFIDLIGQLIEKHNTIVYVGDTIADALLIKKAKLRGLCNILFIGLLCSSSNPDNLVSEFIKNEADAIITDLNDLHYLFS